MPTISRRLFTALVLISISTPIALAGAMGLRQVGFQVPEFPTDRLATSSIVLAAKVENMEGGAAVGPFNIGTTKVIPNLSATYHRGEPVGVYLQVYNTGIDQTTLRPAADVEYSKTAKK